MKTNSFNQPPPALGNQFDADATLQDYLRRVFPKDVQESLFADLRALAEECTSLDAISTKDRLNEPELIQWDAWGERIDHIELTETWKVAEGVAARHGVVAAAYEDTYGDLARVHQFSLAYLFAPVSDFYGCPLAMTDGAARTLLASGNEALIDRAVPHLTTRDPEEFWTSGQWMTESTGGSDVGRSETIAVVNDGAWTLSGRKWFTSAATSQIALTLGRPEGNPAGGHGLALFYVECDGQRGRTIRANRLKDKLGTRKVPTAELTLDDADVRASIAARLRASADTLTRGGGSAAAAAAAAAAREYMHASEAGTPPHHVHNMHADLSSCGLQASLLRCAARWRSDREAFTLRQLCCDKE